MFISAGNSELFRLNIMMINSIFVIYSFLVKNFPSPFLVIINISVGIYFY